MRADKRITARAIRLSGGIRCCEFVGEVEATDESE